MSIDDAGALEALLVRMRNIHAALTEHHAGICVIHLDAAIAALESHLRRLATATDATHATSPPRTLTPAQR